MTWFLKDYLLHDYTSEINEITKRKLSRKKVEREFFWIKMVLLTFTVIIEDPKHGF